MPCRINRQRVWVHRILLESYVAKCSVFLTLTYAPENLPCTGERICEPTLKKSDYKKFLKRLRGRVSPEKVRYFFVGEYGDQTERPHYHCALFGPLSLADPDLLADCWKLGHVHVGNLTRQSAAYIAGYLLKRMTLPGDPRLRCRAPEFAQPSLKPGLGAPALETVAKTLQGDGIDALSEGDVPHSLVDGLRQMPLGRYLISQLRRKCGSEEMQKMSLLSFQQQVKEWTEDFSEKVPKSPLSSRREQFKEFLIDKGTQDFLNQAAIHKIRKATRTL